MPLHVQFDLTEKDEGNMQHGYMRFRRPSEGAAVHRPASEEASFAGGLRKERGPQAGRWRTP